jgi:hypothetical protein
VNLVTFPVAILRRVLRLARRGGPVRYPVGTSHWDGHSEWLAGAPAGATGRHFLVEISDRPFPSQGLPPDCAGAIAFGAGRRRGQARGFAQRGAERVPIDQLKLVGPGMHVLPLAAGTAADGTRRLPAPAAERWSRTISALGEGVWTRLADLHYGIVGVGRSGSILADAVAAGWGARRLSLIDPDVIEMHNLGEMTGVTVADRGEAKVRAVVNRLRRQAPPSLRITEVVSSITHLPALRAVQACDVVFGGLDHDGARLALALLAILFCKPWLDVATGIHGLGDQRRLGADVRLLVPGERCLLCLGGLADPGSGRRVLTSADAEQEFHAARDWRRERAGSLRSLNHLAAALALRLWEDFVAERVTASTWAHLEFDPAGRLAVTYPSPPGPAACQLCALLGAGEEGVPRARALFHETDG